MRRWLLLLSPAVLLVGSCRDDPTGVSDPGASVPPALTPVGLVKVTISGFGDDPADATATSGARILSAPANFNGTGTGDIQLERASLGSFTEGTRGVDGVRYVYATFRVRNAQSNGATYETPRTNLTFVAVGTSATLDGSPVAAISRFDGTATAAGLGAKVVPTGAVLLDDSLKMRGAFPDVLQVFTESEVAAISRPAGVTDVFPYGFVVRNPNSGADRTLPANPQANEFDGQVTFAFRIPLQATVQQDAYSITLMFMAMDDSETRMTESVEEQDSVSHARVKARATALSATTTTVLNGDPFTDFTGQRQICSSRVAGPAGSPTTEINAPGAYTRVGIYGPGESLDACAADFHTGNFSPLTFNALGLNIPYTLTLRAMDRYGNVKTAAADTLVLRVSDNATVPLLPAAVALVSGVATANLSLGSYGGSVVAHDMFLVALGRRQGGRDRVRVGGVTRTWTAGAGTTDWHTNGNWNVSAVPAALDTVLVPDDVSSSLYPAIAANVSISGIKVLDDNPGGITPSVSLGAFDLHVDGNVLTTNNGAITNTSGRLFLDGAAHTVAGKVPVLRVLGTFSLVGNLDVRAPLQIDAGRLTDGTFRINVSSQ
jgi:hypothetical protein